MYPRLPNGDPKELQLDEVGNLKVSGIGATDDAPAGNNTGSFSLIALIKRLLRISTRGTAATATLAFAGNNNNLTATAVYAGPDGNDLQVAIAQAVGVATPISVEVDTADGWKAAIMLPTTPAVAASKTLASGGANNDLTFTAVDAGVDGNDLTVTIAQSAGFNVPLGVTMVGDDATITLPTDAGANASLVVASAGANNDLTFTAVDPGVAGNALEVAVVQGVGVSDPLSVAIALGKATITLPSDELSAPVAATAAQVKAAWDASAAVASMTVAVEGDGTGTVAAAASTPLAGGADGAAVAATAAQVKAAWDASPAVAAMTVAYEGTGAGNVAAAVATHLAGGDDGGDPQAATAAQAKTAWDASAATEFATLNYEGSGAGAIAVAAPVNLSGGSDPLTSSSALAVVVPGAGNTELITIPTAGLARIFVQFTVATQALDTFLIQAKASADAAYATLYSAAGHFTAPSGLLVWASGDLTAVAAAGSGAFVMDVRGLHSVRVLASAAADSASVSVYMGGQE